MKLSELAKELNLSTDHFIKFIQDFDLELSECVTTNFEVKDDFVKFARENISFLKKYEVDLNQSKSVEDIASTIDQPVAKVAEAIKHERPKVYDNGLFKSSVSSFGIDQKLGGNYQFVYDYFGKKTKLAERDFIGYRDLFFFISKTLEPFLDASPLTDWGIHRPAGIILYGPPGSGKIFWANKIAEIIGYDFREIKRHYLGTSFVDGLKTSFNDFLIQEMKREKTLLFMDDFDAIMGKRSEEKSVASCDEATQEVVLHHISRFNDENILMVGSATSVINIDRDIMAPGRFDVMIPVFPPNLQERSEMILYFMTENLAQDAMLMKILIKNNADHLPYWKEIASKMKVFSNTMIVDFAQSLKKRIRNQYVKENKEDINISDLLKPALRDASSKLTDQYLNQIAQFVTDVSINNYDDFPKRIEALKAELQQYKIVEPPRKKIGFANIPSSDDKN